MRTQPVNPEATHAWYTDPGTSSDASRRATIAHAEHPLLAQNRAKHKAAAPHHAHPDRALARGGPPTGALRGHSNQSTSAAALAEDGAGVLVAAAAGTWTIAIALSVKSGTST